MKVLIASFDLFGQIGGGQTFYRNLILRHPNIEFHYLRRNEPENVARPANARAIKYAKTLLPPGLEHEFEMSIPKDALGQITDAENIALAVAGNRYDLVDTPDYDQFGCFLRSAFQRHDVVVDRIALSMHGAISTSMRLNWDGDGTPLVHLQELERLQYEAVDIRYFISEFYRDEWRSLSPLRSHSLDPMWFFDVRKPVDYRPQTERPVLRFIGRTERRKGPHLLVNLLSWLPPGSFEHAEIIGPNCVGSHGFSAAAVLDEMARIRNVPVKIFPAYNAKQLDGVYADRTVTFLPSIYDTLNLVALESLFAGCPTVVGDGAGACRYLRERFPQLPFTEFGTTHFQSNVATAAALLKDYDRQRQLLAESLGKIDIRPHGPSISDIYASAPAFDSSSRSIVENWYRSFSLLNRRMRNANPSPTAVEPLMGPTTSRGQSIAA